MEATETMNGVELSKTVYTPLAKTGPFSEEEKNYLRNHWIRAGRSANEKQEAVSLALKRPIFECRAEYRALCENPTAKKKAEAKRILVESRTTPEYVEDKIIRDLFDRLSPSIKGILGYMAEMGEPDEIVLSKKKGTLMIQFDRSETPS